MQMPFECPRRGEWASQLFSLGTVSEETVVRVRVRRQFDRLLAFEAVPVWLSGTQGFRVGQYWQEVQVRGSRVERSLGAVQ